MLQTRMLFYCLFRFKAQIQLRDAPDTDVILLLIQIQSSDTAQIRSRHRCHSGTHSDSTIRYNSDTLQTRMLFWYSFKYRIQIQLRDAPDTNDILLLIQIQSSDTAQRCSRHGCYSISYSNTEFRYSLEMLQTWMLFYCLFRFKAQIQLRDAPDTDVILLLIQIQSSDTT